MGRVFANLAGAADALGSKQLAMGERSPPDAKTFDGVNQEGRNISCLPGEGRDLSQP
jgi:hypothetical protein